MIVHSRQVSSFVDIDIYAKALFRNVSLLIKNLFRQSSSCRVTQLHIGRWNWLVRLFQHVLPKKGVGMWLGEFQGIILWPIFVLSHYILSHLHSVHMTHYPTYYIHLRANSGIKPCCVLCITENILLQLVLELL